MRHGSSNRRSRGRNNRNKNNGGNNRAKVFDSNGPEVRIRGTAYQICEKYEALAKDALSAGDAILAQSYLQHAEHYQRMIVAWNEEADKQAQQKANEQQDTYSNDDDGDLSLPNSILGDEVKANSKKEDRVLETA